MPDDALVINRAADLPQRIEEALSRAEGDWRKLKYGRSRSLAWHQRRHILAALGVGQPEPVRESDLRLLLEHDPWPGYATWSEQQDRHRRIERVLEGRKP